MKLKTFILVSEVLFYRHRMQTSKNVADTTSNVSIFQMHIFSFFASVLVLFKGVFSL